MISPPMDVELPTTEQAAASLMSGEKKANQPHEKVNTELKSFILCISEING